MLVKVDKSDENTSGHPVLLIAAAVSSEGLPSTIRRCFSHEIKVGPLTEEHRAEMLSKSLQNILSNVSKKWSCISCMCGLMHLRH